MEFGLFQNGFRPTTSPAQTYDEDLAEIVLADQLGRQILACQGYRRHAPALQQAAHADRRRQHH